MAEKKLVKNVTVGGLTYGPDYPENTVTDAEVRKSLTAAGAFEGSEEASQDAEPAPADAEPTPVEAGRITDSGDEPERPEPADVPAVPAEVDVPARRGPGSGKEAWASYAQAQGVQVEDGATRDEIVSALEAAGKPVE